MYLGYIVIFGALKAQIKKKKKYLYLCVECPFYAQVHIFSKIPSCIRFVSKALLYLIYSISTLVLQHHKIRQIDANFSTSIPLSISNNFMNEFVQNLIRIRSNTLLDFLVYVAFHSRESYSNSIFTKDCSNECYLNKLIFHF